MPRIHLTTFIAATEQRVFTISKGIDVPREWTAKYQMKHERFLKPGDNGTILIDYFDYEAPYGVLGKIWNRIYLYKHLTRQLEERNQKIRRQAEKKD